MLDELDRQGAESAAKSDLKVRLGPLLSLAEQLDSLFDRGMQAIVECPRPGAAAKVGLILTSRLANDLRGCALLSQLGYGIQGLVLASTVVEVVGALSYVGYDDSRAVAWSTHKDFRHTFPRRVTDGIAATLAMLSIADPAARRNWEQGYEYMCMAKHANPFIALRHGLQLDSSMRWSHAIGPDALHLGASVSARTLWYSVAFGGFGIHVALGHCEAETARTRLREEALGLNGRLRDLEPWYLTIIERESDSDEGDERQAQALTAEARRLQSEAARLRAQTEMMRRETERLNHKGQGLRRPARKRRRGST